MARPREEIAEILHAEAVANGMDESRVGIHEVSDPSKPGKGGTWLGMFLQTTDFQAEIRVYGETFLLFKVWRPFMGKQITPQNLAFKSWAKARNFFDQSMKRGVWTGKLASP